MTRQKRVQNSKIRSGYVTLERALSKLGYASRKTARALILEKKVKVNGFVTVNPLFQVRPEVAKISISDQVCERRESLVYAFNKPKNAVTTRSDEKGRTTVFDYL